MKTAEPHTAATEVKASEVTSTETGAAETHSSAAAKMHAAAAEVASPSAEVTTASTAEVTTTSATVAAASTAAATGLGGKRRRNSQHRRQQDCANSNSAIFHGLPPDFSWVTSGHHVSAAPLACEHLSCNARTPWRLSINPQTPSPESRGS
jgi:hypothetical protein